MKNYQLPHYEIAGRKNVFIDYDDALTFCDNNKLSYDKIVKVYTKVKM